MQASVSLYIRFLKQRISFTNFLVYTSMFHRERPEKEYQYVIYYIGYHSPFFLKIKIKQ